MKTLKDKIMDADPKTTIDLTEFNLIYKDVKFTIDNKTEYSWVAHSKRSYSSAIFPMKDANYVKFFKTLNGAKRNFLKKVNK